MKTKHSTPLFGSRDVPDAVVWGQHSEHPLKWTCPDEVPRPGSFGTVLYVVALLLALPVYVSVVLCINFLYAGRGLVTAHVNFINNSIVWVLVPLCLMSAVWVLRWLACEPEGLGFCFDEEQQCLTFTQCRPARVPTEERVPYSDIHSITPCKMTASGFICYFSVCFAGLDGKPTERKFWIYLTEKEARFHTDWLRRSIGERMHEVLDLDK
ncbi:hypothetical protein KDX38_05485 [Pseudomonas sp. CDFA 602]|uniref:hypothetical protein n=1 Tax=Pseudomonas californiensis TaxID=2829823 RepID=UPI001E52B984|nr:hypothetical protein [Pseudomonas californiensis]MCD5992783.1 hypothetical protein [Pseudomonas californiensis]MCD5998663.1 hypothetical protein [Pseudomonas californiensis]